MTSSPDPAVQPVSIIVRGEGGAGSNRTIEESWFAARIASGKLHPGPPRAALWMSTWIVAPARTGLTAHVAAMSSVAAASVAARRGWRWRMGWAPLTSVIRGLAAIVSCRSRRGIGRTTY